MQQAFAAAARAVVTVGIRPERPETGFGYIQAAHRADGGAASELAGAADGGATGAAQGGAAAGVPRAVKRFVEKPDRATAEGYLASGDYLWNAGMFFFPARRMMLEIERYLPALAAVLAEIAADAGRTDAIYRTAPRISIDYAVMERLPAAGGMVVVEGAFGWSDVGSWDAICTVQPLDDAGNAAIGPTLALDARGNVLVSAGPLISVLGVTDVVVVATGDAVLVLPRDRAQDVRAIVEALEKSGRSSYL